MLKRLKAWAKNLYAKVRPAKSEWAPFKGQGAFGIPLKRQILKRTHFAPGDQYKVGEGRATVHADEASMLKALALTEYTRMRKEEKLTNRAIELMLMTPEELQQIKVNEYLEKRIQQRSYLSKLIAKLFPTNPEELQKIPLPAPQVEEAKETTKVEAKAKVEDEELVKV